LADFFNEVALKASAILMLPTPKTDIASQSPNIIKKHLSARQNSTKQLIALINMLKHRMKQKSQENQGCQYGQQIFLPCSKL
jgi:hypothetical protein